MHRLYLLRHAKAGWAEPGMRDFDRPLDGRGRAEAEAIGRAMTANGFVPDLTLCSTAVRARETLTGVLLGADTGRVEFVEGLYSADAAGYLDIIRDGGTAGAIMVVGHNPMMEDLASALARDGDADARSRLAHGFPTSALAAIRLDEPLSQVGPGRGYLEAFLIPADL